MIYDAGTAIMACQSQDVLECVAGAGAAVTKDITISAVAGEFVNGCRAAEIRGPEGCTLGGVAVGLIAGVGLDIEAKITTSEDTWDSWELWISECDEKNAEIERSGGWFLLDCSWPGSEP